MRVPVALSFVANRILVYGILVGVGVVLFATLGLFIGRRPANTSLEIAIYLGLALAAGFGVQALRIRVVRAVDRVFFRQRYAAAITLERIREATAFEGSLPLDATAAELAEGLNLASVALFRRAADGGFVREASFGWPDGTAWHLLPTDAVARSLNSGVRQVRLVRDLSRDVALPTFGARPTIALALKRGSRIEGAVLIGPRNGGSMLDHDEARGIADLFSGVITA